MVSVDIPEWHELPQLVLVGVLDHVDTVHRQACCSLVCRSWATAVAGTRRASFPPGTPTQRFKQWLSLPDSRQATSLEFSLSSCKNSTTKDSTHSSDSNTYFILHHLALSNLQELQLRGFKTTRNSKDTPEGFEVQLGPAKGAGVLHASHASLTRLVLDNVIVKGGAGKLQDISVLTSLQHLELGWCGCGESSSPIPGALLPSLPHLTHLTMHYGVSCSTLQHISTLRKLKQLKLGLLLPMHTAAAAKDLSGLQHLQQLTALTIFGALFQISRASTPWIGELPALLQLSLHGLAGIQPAVLRSCSKLHSLRLKGFLLPSTAEHLNPAADDSSYESSHESSTTDAAAASLADPSTEPCSPAEAAAAAPAAVSSCSSGVAALLEVLPVLQHLSHLALPGVLDQAAAPAAAYSALTASSSLRVLELSRACIPLAAWQHIFPPKRQPSSLAQLEIDEVDGALSAAAQSPAVLQHPQQQHTFPPKRQLSSLVQLSLDEVDGALAAAPAIASSCPRLQALTVIDSISSAGCSSGCSASRISACSPSSSSNPSSSASRSSGTVLQQLHPLQSLAGLTCLSIKGPAAELGRALGVLTQLQELSVLAVSGGLAMQEAAALLLRPLTALRKLEVCSVPSHHLMFINEAPAGCAPDVWQQLQQHLARQQTVSLHDPQPGDRAAATNCDDSSSSSSSNAGCSSTSGCVLGRRNDSAVAAAAGRGKPQAAYASCAAATAVAAAAAAEGGGRLQAAVSFATDSACSASDPVTNPGSQVTNSGSQCHPYSHGGGTSIDGGQCRSSDSDPRSSSSSSRASDDFECCTSEALSPGASKGEGESGETDSSRMCSTGQNTPTTPTTRVVAQTGCW